MRKQLFDFLNYLNIVYKLKSPQGLRVLAYHTVPDEGKFKKQLNFLKTNFSLIDIHLLIAHLHKGVSLPKNAVLITFDDGDISVFEKGLPLLKKMSIPAILFVITELIDSNNTFWCRWVEIDHEKKGESYAEAREMIRILKEVPENERKEYLKKLEKVESSQLTSLDLMKLSESNVFIGNHTHTHPMINNCTEAEIREELENSRKEFRKWRLNGFEIFAYPNGNWDLRSEKVLKEEGIELAFLFDHKINPFPIHPLRISRIRVDSDLDLNEFKVKVSGLHSRIMDAKEKLRTVSL